MNSNLVKIDDMLPSLGEIETLEEPKSGSWLPTFSYAWAIQNLEMANYWFLTAGEDILEWFTEPFYLTVIYARNIVRVEDKDSETGTVSYEYFTSNHEDYADLAKDSQRRDSNVSMGTDYVLGLFYKGKVIIAKSGLFKTLRKTCFATFNQAKVTDMHCLQMAANWREILTKNPKTGFYYADQKKIGKVTKVMKMTPEMAKDLQGAMQEKAEEIQNWLNS